MTSLNESSEYADVMQDGYASGAVSVTTSQIEAKVGANRLSNREALTITNKGNAIVYYGPSGVSSTSGDLLYKDQSVSLPIGDLGVFLITASGTATVIVQEMA